MNTKTKSSWATALSIGFTAFAAHAGGGFATGNQANTYFVSLGWVGSFSALLALVLVILDQVVKYLVLTHIPLGGYVPFLPHVVCLTYVQNTGAAFSMFSQHTWILALISLIMSVVLAVALWKNFFTHPLGKVTLALLLAGAVGNLIDRAMRGFVVDMFQLLFMNFAVFNVADICVVVGGIAAAAYYLLLADKLEHKEAPHGTADADR